MSKPAIESSSPEPSNSALGTNGDATWCDVLYLHYTMLWKGESEAFLSSCLTGTHAADIYYW